MNSPVSDLQSCEWLFLRGLSEPRDNALRIVVEEARAGRSVDAGAAAKAAGVLALEPILHDARLIEHIEGCRVFELCWSSYIAYSVRNESFVANDQYEQSEGRLLVKYSKSRFLDYVALGTFASSDYPGPFVHWGVVCGNHIVDVASLAEPEVRVLPNGA
jgi:hypothetical protein